MENKTCENCKFFKPYYVKRKIKLIKTISGRCFNISNKYIRNSSSTCKMWQEYKTKDISEKKETINNLLQKISKNLEEVSFILKDYS